MKKMSVALAMLLAFGGIVSLASRSIAADSGETLFKNNCAPCHVDGGNIVNPQKTLHKKDREANSVKTANDIVKLMRNPGPGMSKFDPNIIPDKQAHEIAGYILKTF